VEIIEENRRRRSTTFTPPDLDYFQIAADKWDEGHDAIDGGPLWDITLDKVFPLPKHKKLYYWFDFGDDWTFEIRKKGKDGCPASGANYPRVVHEDGPKPEQYPRFEEEE